MLLKELEKLADEKEVVGNKIKYHFSKGVVVKSPKIDDVFFDIVKEEGQLVLFDSTSPFARIIEEKDYPNTEIHIRGE